jgi:hypothetical protein
MTQLTGATGLLAEALTALAQAGAAGIVQAVGTDVWASVRRRTAGLFGRAGNVGEQAELDRLDRTAAALDTGDEQEVVRQEAAWEARFEMLLEGLEDDAERERFAAELRALVAEIEQARTPAPGGTTVAGNTFNGPTAVQTGSGNQQFNHFGEQA